MAVTEGMCLVLGKQKPYRNKKILAYARGQDCQIRLTGVCNYNPETTVAAHISDFEFGAGMGVKSDDSCVAFCCSSCHDIIDSRVAHDFDVGFLKSEMHKANTRTIRLLFRDEVIK